MSQFNQPPFARSNRFDFPFHGPRHFGDAYVGPAAPPVPTIPPPRCMARHAPAASADSSRDAVYHYSSLMELSNLLKALDDAPCVAAKVGREEPSSAIVVALPPRFAGHVPALVRRRRLGDQLVLTASSGELQLADWSFVDDSCTLGWREVLAAPDWQAAVRAAYHAVGAAGRVVVYWPAWDEQSAARDVASLMALTAGR